MSTLYGKAAVHGLNGDLAFSGPASTSDQLMQGADTTHSWNEENLVNPASGEIIGHCATQERDEITIEFIPVASVTGTTIAHAKDALKLPTKYALVTLTGFDEGGSNDVNGTYNYIGGGKRVFNEGYCKMTLPLRRYKSVGSTPDILATVIS